MGLCFLVVLCPGAPQGSNGSGSGFKVSQKSHPTDWGKPGIDPAFPGLQGTGQKRFVAFPGYL